MLQQGHLVHKGQLIGGVLRPWNSGYVTAEYLVHKVQLIRWVMGPWNSGYVTAEYLVHKVQLIRWVMEPWKSGYVSAGAFSTYRSIDRRCTGALE